MAALHLSPALRRIVRARRNARIQRTTRKVRPMTPQRPPVAIELSYRRYLLGLITRTRELVRRLVYPRLPALLERGRRGDQRTDAPADDVRELFDVVSIGVEDGVLVDGQLEAQIAEFGTRTEVYQGSELQRQIRQALGVDVPLSDPRFGERLRTWTAENVRLIKTIPRDSLEQVERLVVPAVERGALWGELRAELEARFDVSRARATVIARDQIGKFYGATNRARQTELGISGYVWRTSLDERVRPEHVRREGKSFKWSDAPDDGHPGQPIQCRCTADPDLEPLLAELDL